MLPVTQIDMFYNGLTLRHRDTINVAARGTFMKRRPEECYDLIENMTAHHNDWETLVQWSESSSSITSYSDTEIAALKAEMAKINKNLMKVLQIPQPQVVTTNEFTNFMKANGAILKNLQTNMTSLKNSNIELKNMFDQFNKINTTSSSGSGTLPGNIITNPKEDLKGITTRSGTAYQGPTTPTTSSSPVVECETEATKDTVHPINNKSTKDVQPPVVPSESLILNSEPVISPIIEPIASLVSAPRPNQRPSIPYLSRLQDQKLQLDDHSISRLVGVAEDVFIKMGTFHFLADFVVIDFDADPRTSRYSANYNDMMANQIDVIDMACGEYSQEVLSFSIDFLLEEVDAFLALQDDPTAPEVDQYYELKICEAKSDKSSIDEPPKVELKDLPPHLEYAFLEGDDKLTVIIAKDLSIEEKTTLITVQKLHKRAIAWKLFDIKGIDPEFYTYKILMEEDFEPVVQHQRRVNLKIYDVIKQEHLKLLDAGLIYPISDSPWVSPVHCVPKKGGFTVVENMDNELILTRLFTGWRVCIDY
uniref:Reverse transcriptase domain-containing protein n=1 Tax=Tanacetum cinerariifolium TaxID=118510 RepID=A0A699IXA9_TANCI|nr:reverse transcriptase domain-containing protein [Tanacetum cinerariifolium]